MLVDDERFAVVPGTMAYIAVAGHSILSQASRCSGRGDLCAIRWWIQNAQEDCLDTLVSDLRHDFSSVHQEWPDIPRDVPEDLGRLEPKGESIVSGWKGGPRMYDELGETPRQEGDGENSGELNL